MDQQPIRRTIGRRRQRPRPGAAAAPDAAAASDAAAGPEAAAHADAAARAAHAQMAGYRTRAPKGIFFYRSPEEMDADRLRWTVAAMVEKARSRSR